MSCEGDWRSAHFPSSYVLLEHLVGASQHSQAATTGQLKGAACDYAISQGPSPSHFPTGRKMISEAGRSVSRIDGRMHVGPEPPSGRGIQPPATFVMVAWPNTFAWVRRTAISLHQSQQNISSQGPQ